MKHAGRRQNERHESGILQPGKGGGGGGGGGARVLGAPHLDLPLLVDARGPSSGSRRTGPER